MLSLYFVKQINNAPFLLDGSPLLTCKWVESVQITSAFKDFTWCKDNDINRISLQLLGGLNISSGAGNAEGRSPPKSSKEARCS